MYTMWYYYPMIVNIKELRANIAKYIEASQHEPVEIIKRNVIVANLIGLDILSKEVTPIIEKKPKIVNTVTEVKEVINYPGLCKHGAFPGLCKHGC